MFNIIKIIGVFILILFIFSACGSMSSNSVPNDWDADGDAFDRGDAEQFFEYKMKQERNNQNW